jgi:hypothetical protein
MSSYNTPSNQNINPKSCVYNCNTRIYWNTSENTYYEVFSGNRHQCPNRQQGKKSNNTVTQTTTTTNTNTTNKSNYYKKSYYATQQKQNQPKLKMSNSLELLQGPIVDVQKKYEILSDIVSAEANGKVHGSQSHIVNVANNNSTTIVSLIVYYEVPEGQRDEVKHKFGEYFHTNLVVL